MRKNGTEYQVTVGLKVPIPNIAYSSCNVEVTGKGTDWEALKLDVQNKVAEVQIEVLQALVGEEEDSY